MNRKHIVVTVVALAWLSGSPPALASERTESDFVKACTSSSNLSQAVCECSAKKARGELSADGFAFLVASLEGDDAATAKLRGKLPIDQAMKAGTFMLRGPSQCAQEAAPAD